MNKEKKSGELDALRDRDAFLTSVGLTPEHMIAWR